MRHRSGFALLTTLHVLIVTGVVAVALAIAGRDAFDAGRNRVNAERAYWRAADCEARVRAVIDATLSSTTDAIVRASLWRSLGDLVPADPFTVGHGCVSELEAAGTRLDINHASDEQLGALFTLAGYGSDGANLLTALRTRGPLASIRELADVPGFGPAAAVIARYADVEPARVSLATASLEVLGTVPGFGAEALASVGQKRLLHEHITDLAAFAASLSPAAMTEMANHFAEVTRTVSVDPDAWMVRLVGHSGLPDMTTTIELRLVRDGARASVARRRIDP